MTQSFTYNPASQIRTQDSTNSAYDWSPIAAFEDAYGKNGLNQITAVNSASISYDAKGNLTSDGARNFSYDGRNRLTSVSGSASAALSYDPAGRLTQVAGTATTKFLYEGADVIAEYDGSDNLLRRYVHGPGADEPLVWYEGSGTSDRRFLMADARGSIIGVMDSSGNVTDKNTYDAYGNPASTNVGRFQYTGQMWLAEAGSITTRPAPITPVRGASCRPTPSAMARFTYPSARGASRLPQRPARPNTGAMADLVDRLRALPFFEALDDATTKSIAERGLWFSLAGGWELFSQGANSQTLFFVISGRLIVVRSGSAGDNVLGYIRAGEPVGEMSLLSGQPHSASVYALRDSEILALPRADYDDILNESSDLAVELARTILDRSRHPSASLQQTAPRVFALIGTSPAIDIDLRAKRLAREASRYGVNVRAITEAEEETCYVSFEALESGLDIVILASKVSDSSWYQFVTRHADRFLVLARRDARPPKPFPLSPAESSPARKFRLVDLVVVEEGLKTTPVAEWADAVEASRVFHWRGDASLGKLARVVAGKSVGLVLSGGGARAYAHLGVIRALRERGVPIDFIGGASMGAVVGACFAMGWSDPEIERRIRDGFVDSNPLGDHVLPVVALTRGMLVEERLQKNFGDALIEELETPFFCVSSDLVSGHPRVDTMGVLRKSLRASVSLPGILPPVVDGDALLVDGAVMDNFPTDYMARVHRGLTVGVDVALRGSIRPEDFVNPPSFFKWIFHNGFRSPPPIVALLMRAATAREEAMDKAHPADILITPTIEGVDLRDWKQFEPAVAAGYAAAKAALDESWEDLAPIVAAAKGEFA